MITLNQKILVKVSDSKEYHLEPSTWYEVIGTEMKRGKIDPETKQPKMYNQFLVVNDICKMVSVFPSKCEIVRSDGKPTQIIEGKPA